MSSREGSDRERVLVKLVVGQRPFATACSLDDQVCFCLLPEGALLAQRPTFPTCSRLVRIPVLFAFVLPQHGYCVCEVHSRVGNTFVGGIGLAEGPLHSHRGGVSHRRSSVCHLYDTSLLQPSHDRTVEKYILPKIKFLELYIVI